MSQLKPDQELLFDLILTEGQIANLILAMEDGLEKQRQKEPDFYEGTGDSDAVKHYIYTLNALFKGTVNKNQDYDNNDVTFDYHENQLYLKYQIYISLLILNMYLHQIRYSTDLTDITDSKNITVAQYAINFSTKLYWLIKKSTQFISFNDTSTILRDGTIAEYADFDEKITGCDSLYKNIKFSNFMTTTTQTNDKNEQTVVEWYLLPNSFHELTNETLYEDLKKIITELAKEYCLSEVKELQKTINTTLKSISLHMVNVDLEQLFTNTLTYIQTKMLDFSSISVVEYLNSVIEEIQSAIYENQLVDDLNGAASSYAFGIFKYAIEKNSTNSLSNQAFSVATINDYLTHKMVMFNNVGQYIDNCLFFLTKLIDGTKSQNLTECHEELSLCIEAYQKQFNTHDSEYNIIEKPTSTTTTTASNSPLLTTTDEATIVLNEISYLKNLINGIVNMEVTTGYESDISIFDHECKSYSINTLIKNLTVETLKTHTNISPYSIRGSDTSNIFDLIYHYEHINGTTKDLSCGKYVTGELYRNYHTAMLKLSSSIILLYFLQKFYEYIGLYSNLRQVKTRQSIQNQLYREIPNCAPGEYIRIKILQNKLIRLTQSNNTEENNRNIKTRDDEPVVDTTDNIYKGLLNLMYSLIYYNNKIVKDLNNPEEFEILDPNCLYPHSYVSPIHLIYDDDTWKETLLRFVKSITHEYNVYFCIKDYSEINPNGFKIKNEISEVKLKEKEIKFGLLINYLNYVAQGILNTNIDSKKIDQKYVYNISDLQIFLTELIYVCNAMTVHWSNINILDEDEENIIGIGKILNFTYNDLAARTPYRTVNVGITYDTSKVSLEDYVYPKGTYKMKVVRFIYNEMLRMINATNIHLKIKMVYMFVLYVINAYLLHVNIFNMNPLEKNPSK